MTVPNCKTSYAKVLKKLQSCGWEACIDNRYIFPGQLTAQIVTKDEGFGCSSYLIIWHQNNRLINIKRVAWRLQKRIHVVWETLGIVEKNRFTNPELQSKNEQT